MNSINPSQIKKDFPIFSRLINGNPLVYLDSTATAQKPNSVIDALSRFYRESNANIHRGVYPLAEEATTLYEESRQKTAAFIGSKTSENVIFTRNTTEAINLVAHSWARKFLKAGDEILITALEHHANFVPWYLLSKERGVKIKTAPLNADLTLDMTAFKKLLTPSVKLVAFTACSNVLGVFTPVDEIIRLARANKSFVLVDAAQSVPHLKTDVEKMAPDFLAFSAHKMLGPTGIGVLWVKPSVLDTMDPFLGGGEMISTVSVEETTWADVPYKFEAGTPNFGDAAAFSAALDYLNTLGLDAIRAHEMELTDYALTRLAELPDLTVYGPKNSRLQGGTISFNHNIVHAHDVGTILGEQGVCIRVGHHCAQPLMRAIGVSSTARASFYIYNTKDDVDALIKALARVNAVFGLSSGTAKK